MKILKTYEPAVITRRLHSEDELSFKLQTRCGKNDFSFLFFVIV